MTSFKQYISNPMGEKNAVISNREMYRTFYTSKFDKLMVRENGKVDHYLYKGKDNEYIIHLKIPSEVVEEFYYDVVIRFYDEQTIIPKSLEDMKVQFFSNDPSFIFTFAHAFMKNDLFFNDLKSKLPRLVIKDEAKEKNPKNEIGYVKSLYFAYIYMKNKGLFNKIHYVSADKYNKKELLEKVMNADEKIRLREEASIGNRKPKKKSNQQPRRQSSNFMSKLNDLIVKNTKKVGDTRNTKNSSRIKSTKSSKRG